MQFSDGHKISQMIQFVFSSYVEIIKFNITRSEFEKESPLSIRINHLMNEKFVARLLLMHKVNIVYPSIEHLQHKLYVDDYLKNSAAFKNSGFQFSHP